MDINFDYIIERDKLNSEYEKSLKNHKILYISAAPGYGKTTSVLGWLRENHKNYAYATAEDEDFFENIEKAEFKKKRYIVIDDISHLRDEAEKADILDYIEASDARFILIGRNELPSFLKPLLVSGQISCFDQDALSFDEEETKELFELLGVRASEKDILRIMKDTQCMPLGIMLIAKRMKNGRYTIQVNEEAKTDYFDCLDYVLYQKLTETQRIFILNLATVEVFDVELALMLTGLRDIEEQMLSMSDFGSIFQILSGKQYRFAHAVIREYFLQKQNARLSKETILQLYQKAGLYYELRGNMIKALEYYDKGGNRDKLSALLIENTKQNGVSANYFETEKYYNTLSENQIKRSPELMCGMAMLNSICLRPKESEKWYERLKIFLEYVDKRDGRYKTARDKLFYLDIALPHRNIEDLQETMQKLATIYVTKRISIQEISPTGNMPSIMNGGKDFCRWLKNDRIMWMTMKKPFEVVLGECGVGLAEGGLGESIFEKTTDLNFTEPLSYLNKALSEVTNHGTILMKFAILGIMSRIFAGSGSIDSALGLIETFQDTVERDMDPILAANIEAWLTELRLLAGDKEEVEEWMRESAPDEFFVFYSSTWLQYQVKSKIYVMNGRYTEALSLLVRMQEYCINYDRTYGYLKSKILLAMVHYRMGEAVWEEELTEAVQCCEEYQLVRILADEGIAILEPLTKLKYIGDSEFYKILVSLTRAQAVNYPMYLVKKEQMTEDLTDMEKNVLKLMIQGLTNDKIADILGVTLRTVKYHAGNIYSKLGVKNRTAAIARVNGYVE